MQMLLLAVGRMKAGPERELLARYVERAQGMARSLGFSGVTLVEIDESRSRDVAERRRDEARALLSNIRAGTFLVALDERGRATTSADFAKAMRTARDTGGPAFALVVGGPDGLDDPLRGQADMVLAYGASTFPHQIVRVLAAEQIYRAMTIIAGHPYHRV
jgi:23S rRNA (pseudouridine1915-N3)-methyltransferase